MGIEQQDADAQPRTAFARTLREAVQRRRVPLRKLQERLRDRGHDVSVATLSQWQSGVRTPGPGSLDIVHELESLLALDEDALALALPRNRRLTPDANVPFAELIGLEVNEVTDEGAERQLTEVTGTLMSFVDDQGRIVRNVLRNIWQVRVDGVPAVPTFITIEPGEVAAPRLRPLIGCELADIVNDMDQRIIRMVLSSTAPMHRGDMLLTEWESYDHRYSTYAMSETQGYGAVRREAQAGMLVYFHPDMLPRRCWAVVQSDGPERVIQVPLVGNCASHIELDFGPGTILLEWEW